MTGLPLHNFPAFEDAATRLRAAGWTVLSPHENPTLVGFDPKTDDFDLRAALQWDVEAVMRSEAVVLLPGWETSPGCAVEILTAEGLAIPVVTLDEFLPPPSDESAA